METRITKLVVDDAKAGAKDRFLWDDAVSGFGLKVTPSGGKVYVVQFRAPGRGRAAVTQRFTIGRHGSPWTPDEARKEARKILRLVAEGRDPLAERRQSREQDRPRETVAEAIERYIEAYAKKHGPRQWREVARTLRHDPGQAWRDKAVADITAKDVAALLESIVARGAPSQANHVHRNLSTFFNWCASPAVALVASSPLAGLDKPAVEAPRDRVLEDHEIALVWRAAEAQGYPFGPCIQLLMLTAQRRDEVTLMVRSEVDLDKATWTLPPSRTKNAKAHIVPLAPMALSLLKGLPWDAEHAFTTTRKGPVSNLSRLKSRLDWVIVEMLKKQALDEGRDPAAVTALPHWTYHDFRRTASSSLARLGVPLHVTEKLLNHQPQAIRGVAAIYNRYEFLDERRRALEVWEAHVRKVLSINPPG